MSPNKKTPTTSRKGRLEKKYWDQIVLLAPPVKLMIQKFDDEFGCHEYALEKTIHDVLPYLNSPIRANQVRQFSREFVAGFVNHAVFGMFPGKEVDSAAEAYVLSRISSRQIIDILKKGGDSVSVSNAHEIPGVENGG